MRLSQKCNLSHGAPRQLYGIEMYAKWPSTPCQRQACAQADTRVIYETYSYLNLLCSLTDLFFKNIRFLSRKKMNTAKN